MKVIRVRAKCLNCGKVCRSKRFYEEGNPFCSAACNYEFTMAAPPVGGPSKVGSVCSECGRTVTEDEYSRGESACCDADVVGEEQFQ